MSNPSIISKLIGLPPLPHSWPPSFSGLIKDELLMAWTSLVQPHSAAYGQSSKILDLFHYFFLLQAVPSWPLPAQSHHIADAFFCICKDISFPFCHFLFCSCKNRQSIFWCIVENQMQVIFTFTHHALCLGFLHCLFKLANHPQQNNPRGWKSSKIAQTAWVIY